MNVVLPSATPESILHVSVSFLGVVMRLCPGLLQAQHGGDAPTLVNRSDVPPPRQLNFLPAPLCSGCALLQRAAAG